nr:dihydroxyacetone kinase subunit DhaK [Sodalis-like endosymbiont of Proechinophthirus fluctus]
MTQHSDKVGLVTGGVGSGHEPAFLGYLGEGMLNAVAFSSPTANAFLAAIRAADMVTGSLSVWQQL